MSEISFDEAAQLFARMPARLQLATLHPAYVLADTARERSSKPVFFAYRRDGYTWLHCAQLRQVPATALLDCQSPYGYGGPIADTADPDFLAAAWSAWCAWCLHHRILAEFVRFHPLAENWLFFGGDVLEDRETVVVDLEPDDPMSGYQGRVRTVVRKAIKAGAHCRWDGRAQAAVEFGSFYREAMHAIGAGVFYHFGDEYFASLFRTGLARVMICLLDHAMVAAAMFLLGPRCMEYHLAASNDAGRKSGCATLLLHAAAEAARGERLAQLYLGGGTSGAADNPLFLFKRGFSHHLVPFRIGRKVHMTQEYGRMSEQWLQRTGGGLSRVLFYR